MKDSTQRFSNRVENYIKYRPGYPPAVLDLLKADCGLTESSVVADVGSGTGILSKLLLENGNRVLGIEPNREMREAGERLLRDYSRFTSIAATAEDTTLEDHSVVLVTAGQAFHWFDRERARREFVRILKPAGWVVLVWNERRTNSTPFLRAYERLLRKYGTDYATVNHTWIGPEILNAFFGSGGFRRKTLDNRQIFDFEGVRGRLLSSSYVPEAGQPNHEAMVGELKSIFEAHQVNGTVTFKYDTTVQYGQLPPR